MTDTFGCVSDTLAAVRSYGMFASRKFGGFFVEKMSWKIFNTFGAAILAVPALLLCSSSPASATLIINGTLNIGGAVSVSDRQIDWFPLGGGTGLFNITDPGTGYFAALASTPSTYQGDMVDLSSPTPVPPLPVGFGVDNFMSNIRFIVGGAPAPAPFNTLHFDLKDIPTPVAPACTGAEAVSASCTQGLFLLTKVSDTETTITLRVLGYFEDTGVNCLVGTPVGCTAATGRYSTQYGNSIAFIKGEIDAGRSITASFSANFDSGVPEPSTWSMLLCGGGLIAAGLRRRLKA